MRTRDKLNQPIPIQISAGIASTEGEDEVEIRIMGQVWPLPKVFIVRMTLAEFSEAFLRRRRSADATLYMEKGLHARVSEYVSAREEPR